MVVRHQLSGKLHVFKCYPGALLDQDVYTVYAMLFSVLFGDIRLGKDVSIHFAAREDDFLYIPAFI